MSTATVTACRVCSGPLGDPPMTGRPPAYCSEACRRSAEFSIRRIDRRLQDLEQRCSDARIEMELGYNAHIRKQAQKELRIYAAEAKLLEGRLRAMIA